jgi:hypothetical protein
VRNTYNILFVLSPEYAPISATTAGTNPKLDILKESSVHPVGKHVEQKRTPKIGPGVNLVRVKLIFGRQLGNRRLINAWSYF